MRVIDLRSDTKTRPTPAMRKAMAEAEVGDDMLAEDPTVNKLEEMSAERTGKEAAVLLSSGTMGNLVASLTYCQRGTEMIVGDRSHIFRAEAAGASGLGGIAYRTVANDSRGMISPKAIENAINPNDQHYAPTKMIAIENTHNSCGGTVLTPADVKAIGDVAKAHKLPLHMDGARIFNAAVYLETPLSELVREADMVTFCLSKGLGCPIGSMLCGTREAIDQARRWRKALGGATRQAGVIAAAGVVALEQMVDRMADDHANARKLAFGLANIKGFVLDPGHFQTNLVFADTTFKNALEIARKLDDQGVKVNARGYDGKTWRFVTHADVNSADIDFTLKAISATVKAHAVF
ncbi:MAG: low-specificity L-threonine aldolase [SAR202 cluster bacterium]|nr:low-specificity L-threonine aldolase [SAR202 cluster bacterium]